MPLPGRAAECARLEQLLQDGATGRAAALRVVGKPGIGKSALLEYVARHATGYRVLRVRGVAAEHEMPYAGLQLLCATLLHDLQALEPGQREALATAAGVTAGQPPDRFLVSLAMLNLLTSVAATQPVCCIVDDAHLLDHASMLVLAFVARRVQRSASLILFGEDDQQRLRELDAVPEMHLEPLAWGHAQVVLAAAAPGRIDAAVTERILIEAGGNPRALVEAFDGITAAELAGGYAIPVPRSGHRDVDHDCVQRARQLPSFAWRLLLVAAAEPTGDPTIAWRAAAGLGVGLDAAQALEAQGLLAFGPRIVFGCAQLRAAVYAAATPAELDAVHRALADATDSEKDADRRAWHLALSTNGLDDGVADHLERYTSTAQARGGSAARAAFLEKAALLSANPVCRGRRALAAAAAKHAAGGLDAAQRLLAIAEIAPADDARKAQIALLRARITFTVHRDNTAPQSLLDAARSIAPHSPALSRQAHLEALVAAMAAGHLAAAPSLRDVAHVARAAAEGSVHPIDVLLGALATRVLDGYVAAMPALSSALGAFHDERDYTTGGWRWLAGTVAAELWNGTAWTALGSGQGERTWADDTDSGSAGVADLPTPAQAPAQLAIFDVYRGNFDDAQTTLTEAAARAAAVGATPLIYPSLLLAAWQGRHGILHDLLPKTRRDARYRGDALTLSATSLAEAVMYNSVGHYERALTAAHDAVEADQLGLSGWALPELIEAAVRSGHHDAAGRALTRLSDRVDAAATDWGAGVRAASSALLADDRAAEALYREAINRLSRTGIRIHLGRAQLLYGEWLRRQNRRIDARVPLRAARELFATVGAEAFADRARSELLATGEKARKRSVDTDRRLTPQELRIAYLARDGLTNPQIGAQLFVSPRTVEYHLHKVFVKLGITLRTELHLVLDAAEAYTTIPLHATVPKTIASAQTSVS